MALAEGIGFGLMFLIITGVIIYIVIQNNSISQSLKENRENTSKLGTSLLNTQDVVKTSLVTKQSINDIQNNIVTNMDSNDKVLKGSLTGTMQALESETKKRSEVDKDLSTRLTNESASRASLSNLVMDEKRIREEHGTKLTQQSNSINALDSSINSLKKTYQEMITVTADVSQVQIQADNNSTELALLTDSMRTSRSAFATSNMTVNRSLAFADPAGSYMLQVGASNLNLQVRPTSGFAVTASNNTELHTFAANGIATHIGGVNIPASNCISFNTQATDQVPGSNRICYGTEGTAPVLNIYGGGRRDVNTRKVKVLDDLEVQNSISCNEIKIGGFLLKPDVSRSKLVIHDFATQKQIAAFYNTNNNTGNRFEVYGQMNGANPMWYVQSSTGNGQTSTAV